MIGLTRLGLVFEGFGPIGERRETDLGGRPVDTMAVFPDGSQRDGVADLRRLLYGSSEQADFVDNLCRKLLSYALGRSLQLSDEPACCRNMRDDCRQPMTTFRQTGGNDRHQPTVSKQTRSTTADRTASRKRRHSSES